MDKEIKEIIIKEFNKVEKHYKNKRDSADGFIVLEQLRDSIIKNEHGEYADYEIEFETKIINDLINESKREFEKYKNKLNDCEKVLNYFKED